MALDRFHFIDDLWRPTCVADPPACHRIALGDSINSYHLVVQFGACGANAAEWLIGPVNVLVNIVGKYHYLRVLLQDLSKC